MTTLTEGERLAVMEDQIAEHSKAVEAFRREIYEDIRVFSAGNVQLTANMQGLTARMDRLADTMEVVSAGTNKLNASVERSNALVETSMSNLSRVEADLRTARNDIQLHAVKIATLEGTEARNTSVEQTRNEEAKMYFTRTQTLWIAILAILGSVFTTYLSQILSSKH